MSNTWFTADPHFGHSKIIGYCNRPFKDIQEHDRTLLDNINSSVQRQDVLWILGDFSFSDIISYREAINCWSVNICWGNHDKWRKEYKYHKYFQKRVDQVLIHVNEQPIFLNHYPMRSWHLSHYNSWHLFGHVHGAFDKEPLGLSLDVGVDSHNYKPWSFDEIKDTMSRRNPNVGRNV